MATAVGTIVNGTGGSVGHAGAATRSAVVDCSDAQNSSQTWGCNGSGVTVNLESCLNCVLDLFFDVDHESGLKFGRKVRLNADIPICNFQLTGGSTCNMAPGTDLSLPARRALRSQLGI